VVEKVLAAASLGLEELMECLWPAGVSG
jgi:hypothetical protein